MGDLPLRRAAELAELYLTGLPERGVAALTDLATTAAALDGDLPEEGVDPLEVIEQLASTVGPATVASAGPRYFGFVVGGALPAALAADWLVSAWDQTAYSAVSSPAGAAVEAVAERWVLDLLGLPPGGAVGFVTGATAGNLVGLLAARHRLLEREGWDVEALGLHGAPRIRVLVGDEVHPSLLLALRIAGFGDAAAERVAVDGQGAMRAAALEAALEDERGPAIVCAQAGNVNTGACDPLAEIAPLAKRARAWLHVDGAFGLWAAASPALRGLVDGAAEADSLAVDCHKWLNVPYDSGLAIISDPASARAALGTSASYLPSAGEREPGDLVPEMSRRARAIPVYAALRSLGRRGVAAMVERCCAHARLLAESMAAIDGAEVLNDVVLNQVLIRFDDDDETTQAMIEAVQRGGEAWVGGTRWRGRFAVRVSISSWATEEGDVARLASALGRAVSDARRGGVS